MGTWKSMLWNVKTTLLGFLGGASYYVFQSGVKIPTNKEEWKAFVVGLFVAGLGLAAKDATTGSKPQ